jgi:CRP-like cAMP-binding protein
MLFAETTQSLALHIERRYPGTAFTRSIGDATAERIGVFAEPEVVSKTLHSEHPFLVIASDGVWEFLSSQSVVDMVSKFDDPQDACLSVIAESYRLWLANDTRTDDITMVVVQFSGLLPELQTVTLPTPLGAMLDFSSRPVARRALSRHPALPPIEPLDSSASAQWAQGAKRRSEAPGASTRSSAAGTAWQPLPATSLTSRRRSSVGGSPESSAPIMRLLPGVAFTAPGVAPTAPAGPGPSTVEQFEFLERAVARHFLLSWLRPDQRRVVLGLFQRMAVSPGDLIVRQGDPGDHFYVIESGQYDVYLYQPGAEQPEHVHTYESSDDPSKRPVSFGELALLHCKPRAASVLARSGGALWTLQRSTLRQALRMLDLGAHRDLPAVIAVLRGVEVLRCLSSSLLRRIALAMETKEYLEGETIIHQGDTGSEFYLVRSGQMVCSVRKSPAAAPQEVLRLAPGQYFGEKALLAPAVRAATVAAAYGPASVLRIGRAALMGVIGGSLGDVARGYGAWQEVLGAQREVLARKNTAVLGGLRSGMVSLDDLDPRGVLFSADVSAMMLMEHRKSEAVLTVRMTSVQDATALRRQPLVLRARDITRSLEPSFFVPGVLKSFKDDRVLAEVLTTVGLCTLDMLLTYEPLDERSSAFVAASVLLGLEHLHWSDVVYRGLAASTVVVTEAGQVQLVDFRFATRSSGRAYTLCGHPEYLAPEVVQGRGHDECADLWSLGVLVFRMLSGRPPFAAPGDDEMRVYRRIVAGKAPALPASVSAAGADLVRRLLVKDPASRLGYSSPFGMRDLKAHAWFAGVDWDALQAHRMPAPKGIRELIYLFEGTPSVPCEPKVCDADSSWIQAF